MWNFFSRDARAGRRVKKAIVEVMVDEVNHHFPKRSPMNRRLTDIQIRASSEVETVERTRIDKKPTLVFNPKWVLKSDSSMVECEVFRAAS